MPVTCLVVGCESRSNRDDVKFFSVPAVLSHKFLTDKNELSERRRAVWIRAIKRDDLTHTHKTNKPESVQLTFYYCKPAALEDENHPDWVSSQEMGHTSKKVHRQQDDVERVERLEKRRKLRAGQVNEEVEVGMKDHDIILETGVASQTDITIEKLKRNIENLRD